MLNWTWDILISKELQETRGTFSLLMIINYHSEVYIYSSNYNFHWLTDLLYIIKNTVNMKITGIILL